MSEARYTVYLTGAAPGRNPFEVQNNLAKAFKTTPEKILEMYKNRPAMVRKGLDKETALKFKKTMESAGATCKVTMSTGTKTGAAKGAAGASKARPADQGKPAGPGKGQAKAKPAAKVDTMVCPKCGHEQPRSDSCLQCGIVIAKFQKSQGPTDSPQGAAPGDTGGSDFMPANMSGVQIFEEQEDREPLNFFDELPAAFIYPFVGNGKFIVLAGVSVFVVFHLLSYVLMFGSIFALFWSGYLAAYMIKVVNSSADGDMEPPHWPGFSDLGDGVVYPLLKVIWTSIVCYTPAVLYTVFMFRNMGLEFSPLADPVLFLLLVGGSFYYPMALLAVAMSGNFLALNPLVVVPAILKTLISYIIGAFVYLIVVAVSFMGNAFLNLPVPILGYAIQMFLSIYFMLVEMRILGLIYNSNAETLGWYRD